MSGRKLINEVGNRLDNSKSYTVENCVPCCKTCNYMKRDMIVEDFLSHIRVIGLHRNIEGL